MNEIVIRARCLDQVDSHLKGVGFQLKEWESLLQVPVVKVTIYGAIAKEIKNPKASRAVGMATGNNPVAFLIPCHRATQENGSIDGYMWGKTGKSAIIGWESLKESL